MTYDREAVADIISKLTIPSWDEIPDIGLYMDQAVTVLNGLGYLHTELTPNMVNNYVKEGYLAHPVSKKYTREQMIRLELMTIIKPVLAIPYISAALDAIGSDNELPEEYGKLVELQKKAAAKLSERIRDKTSAVYGPSLALELCLEASLLRLAAESILAGETDTVPQGKAES